MLFTDGSFPLQLLKRFPLCASVPSYQVLEVLELQGCVSSRDLCNLLFVDICLCVFIKTKGKSVADTVNRNSPTEKKSQLSTVVVVGLQRQRGLLLHTRAKILSPVASSCALLISNSTLLSESFTVLTKSVKSS